MYSIRYFFSSDTQAQFEKLSLASQKATSPYESWRYCGMLSRSQNQRNGVWRTLVAQSETCQKAGTARSLPSRYRSNGQRNRKAPQHLRQDSIKLPKQRNKTRSTILSFCRSSERRTDISISCCSNDGVFDGPRLAIILRG